MIRSLTSLNSRPCPVPLCGGSIARGHLMCRSCWSAVPAKLKREVNRTWQIVRTPSDRPAKELLEDIRTYRDARDAAIKAAEEARP